MKNKQNRKTRRRMGGLILATVLCTTILGACKGEEKTGYEVWSTYNTRKIIQNPSDNSIYDKLPAELSVQMMKDETEGAQLVITANQDINAFSLTASALEDKNGNTIPVDDIVVYQQKYVEIEKMHSTNKEIHAGDFVPDMLLPMETAIQYKENKVDKGNNQGLTIEITTSSETVPGTYNGTFVLDIDGEKQDIPVTCEVWDIEYEGKRTFQTSFLLYRHQLLAGEYDDSDEMVNNYIDFFLKYKVNTYVIKGAYDLDEFQQEAIRLFEDDNFNSIIIPINFDLSYKSSNTQADSTISFIRKLVEITTEEKPYIDYAYFYPSNMDEADMETGGAGGSKAKMAAARSLMAEGGELDKTLQRAVSEFERDGLFNRMTPEFTEHVKQAILDIPAVFTNVGFVESVVSNGDDTLGSVFCPYLSLFDNDIQAQKYQEQAENHTNGDLWTYTCTGPLFPYPSFHTDDYSLGARVTGWMEKKYDINGFLYWSSVRNMDGEQYIDVYNTAARYSYCSGEGYLVYPGKYYGSSTPFPSLRLISHRESMDDYDMLCVYENLLNEYAEKYGITGGLDLNDYVSDIYDSLFTGAIYYTDDSLVYAAREELAKRIIALRNDDQLVVKTEQTGSSANLKIYTTADSLKVNDDVVTGAVSGRGYVYETTVDTKKATTVTIETAQGSYSHSLNAGVTVLDVTKDLENVVCTGKKDVKNKDGSVTDYSSTRSTITAGADGQSADVLVRTYFAKGYGYSANVDQGGIDDRTKKLMVGVTIPVKEGALENAENVHFTLKNTGDVKIEMYVYVRTVDGEEYEIGTAYCGVGKTQDVRIHIDDTAGFDTSEVVAIRLLSKSTYADASGYENMWADRQYNLSNVWVEKKEAR